MAREFKTGGRQKGTPNKATDDVRATLAALGCDPIAGMAAIAMEIANTSELRGRMLAELAGYWAPKRKAVELSGEVTQAPLLDYRKLPPHVLAIFTEALDKAEAAVWHSLTDGGE